MSLFDAFGYAGRRVLVVGGASGIGAAVAELVRAAGAEVVVADYAPVTLDGVKALQVNLADKASIDAALAELGGPVQAVFSCAGVAQDAPGIEKINFVGHRYLVDRLLADGQLPAGSAVGFISSAAGLGWEANLPKLTEWLAVADYDGAAAWAVENGHADYMHTKQAICAYVATQAMPLLRRGVRVNAICPGPTDTPLARANSDTWLAFGADYRAEVGVAAATPLEQAYPLVFLCSPAASAISGITLLADSGYFAAGLTDVYPPAAPIVKFLSGKISLPGQ